MSHLSTHIARSVSHAHVISAVASYAQHVHLYHECNCTKIVKPASTPSHPSLIQHLVHLPQTKHLDDVQRQSHFYRQGINHWLL